MDVGHPPAADVVEVLVCSFGHILRGRASLAAVGGVGMAVSAAGGGVWHQGGGVQVPMPPQDERPSAGRRHSCTQAEPGECAWLELHRSCFPSWAMNRSHN